MSGILAASSLVKTLDQLCLDPLLLYYHYQDEIRTIDSIETLWN